MAARVSHFLGARPCAPVRLAEVASVDALMGSETRMVSFLVPAGVDAAQVAVGTLLATDLRWDPNAPVIDTADGSGRDKCRDGGEAHMCLFSMLIFMSVFF